MSDLKEQIALLDRKVRKRKAQRLSALTTRHKKLYFAGLGKDVPKPVGRPTVLTPEVLAMIKMAVDDHRSNVWIAKSLRISTPSVARGKTLLGIS